MIDFINNVCEHGLMTACNAIVNKMEQPSSNVSNKESKTIVGPCLDHMPWTLQINTQVTDLTLRASVTGADTLTFYTSLRGQSTNWAKLCLSSQNFNWCWRELFKKYQMFRLRTSDCCEGGLEIQTSSFFIILNWSIDIKSIFCHHIKAWGDSSEICWGVVFFFFYKCLTTEV